MKEVQEIHYQVSSQVYDQVYDQVRGQVYWPIELQAGSRPQ